MKAIVRLLSVPAEKRDLPWVQEALRAAMQLELSTIPPYLYAAWSVDPAEADGSGCVEAIKGIAREEMLHLGIAANLLTAVGGRPDFVRAASAYPAVLPHHVHEGLVVELAPLSHDVLLHTFMVIEEPVTHLFDDGLFIPTGAELIGHFYADVLAAIESLAPTFSTTGQVDLSTTGLNAAGLSTVSTLDDVRAGIAVITRQGEGTSSLPFDDTVTPPELAHFYQFGEMAHGARLTPSAPFSYTGDPVTVPPARAQGPAAADLPTAKTFDTTYSDMLRALQRAWDTGNAADDLGTAVGLMFVLVSLADDLFAAGTGGPGFRALDEQGNPVGPAPGADRFLRIKQILDTAVGPLPVHAHGTFWRSLSRDQFVAKAVLGKPLLTVGDGAGSNLVKALRGEFPFGRNLGVVGATIDQMPKGAGTVQGRTVVPDVDIDFIESWIDDGCPEAPAATAVTAAGAIPAVPSTVSLSAGAFRPDPQVHVDYFRDLDDWAAWHATPEIAGMIQTVQDAAVAWLAAVTGDAVEQSWVEAISTDGAQAAFTMLAEWQQSTVEAHYGVPVPLLTVLDGYERFGNDGLPDDPLRPLAPRHNMDSPIMWFFLAAFAEACLRLGIATEFWTFFQRPILCGLLNDGLFRNRFPVKGFAATAAGRDAVYAFVQQVPDAGLATEIRRRYVDSALTLG